MTREEWIERATAVIQTHTKAGGFSAFLAAEKIYETLLAERQAADQPPAESR